MPALAYEELHDFKATGHYAVPNEGTIAWNQLLQGLRIHRAAGICSSGEVGFFAILPLVRKELVLVDHSLQSLQVAMVKYALLQRYTAAEVLRMFKTGNAIEIGEAVEGVKNLLPPGVREAFTISKRNYNDARDAWLCSTKEADQGTSHYYSSNFDPVAYADSEDRRAVALLWAQFSEELVKKAKEKADRVRFVHGDLRDLKDTGKFNLIYLSNALEHTSQHRGVKNTRRYDERGVRIPNTQTEGALAVQDALVPGGYVALAHRPYTYDRAEEPIQIRGLGWTLVNKITGGSMNWTQSLWQVPA